MLSSGEITPPCGTPHRPLVFSMIQQVHHVPIVYPACHLGHNSAGFSARGTLKRSDFGMKTFLGAIGDEVDLIVEVEAKQKS